MTDTAQERVEGEYTEIPSREDFQRWVEEYLHFSGKGISDYYPDMGSYLHDQLVRWRHGRRLRARQREDGGGKSRQLLRDCVTALESLDKMSLGRHPEHGYPYRDELLDAIRGHLDATPQREGEPEPVAWRYRWPEERGWRFTCDRNRLPPQVNAQLYGGERVAEVQPLYTEPPAEREGEREPDDALGALQAIRSETTPIQGHPDPGALRDCFDTVEEALRDNEPAADTEQGEDDLTHRLEMVARKLAGERDGIACMRHTVREAADRLR